ncbi:hypothetical protein QG37_06945 [Candidozyma auris]|uniref:Uncharacterized protein n=1 Tax=Candidozyma auris TaxID=498019 RepID=A0A0L0NR52_CANAR|nr:hypothetical protein QG37_06945 [[Candida] auris]
MVLSPFIPSSLPFNHKLSLLKSGDVAAEVNVLKSFWSKVTEMEELVGRLRVLSLFPQYLRVCWLVIRKAYDILVTYSNVHGGSGRGGENQHW